MTAVTRFAPSPTGELHLGSAYSARIAWQRARQPAGTFLVRIEDIDIRRCRREYETAILADLRWLGLAWDGKVRRQSDHFSDYGRALGRLDALGLVYPCFCSRAEIEQQQRMMQQMQQMQGGAGAGPGGPGAPPPSAPQP